MDPARLLSDEAENWDAFVALLDGIDRERWLEPTVTPDRWDVRDTVHHVGAWLEACADVLEAIANGTWDADAEPEETPASIDAFNRERVREGHVLDPDEAMAYTAEQRGRARTGWGSLRVPTADAWSWFEESGPLHYAKHVHDLTAWLEGVVAGRG